jgi:hypothetical protein
MNAPSSAAVDPTTTNAIGTARDRIQAAESDQGRLAVFSAATTCRSQ